MELVGIDEVGRGAWAGPLVAGAVLLPSNAVIEGLADSKKLTPKKRAKLDQEIRKYSLSWGVGWSSVYEIDKYGLTWAVRQAMMRAMDCIDSEYSQVIVDGNYDFLAISNSRAVVGADMHYPAVSAASVIAKVARDNYMKSISKEYPEYRFDKHVGYGTLAHRKSIEEHGLLPIHRRSFRPIRELLH